MKKILVLGGLATIGYSFYYYFKKQLSLALNYDYRIKNIKVLNLTNDNATIECSLEIINKSTFQIEVLGYDITLKLKGVPFANTKSEIPFLILPDSSFTVNANGNIDFKKSKEILFPFIKDVLAKKPVDIEVDGFISVKFLNLQRKINFDNSKFTYSENLLRDYGIEDEVDRGVSKVKNILGKIGIKI